MLLLVMSSEAVTRASSCLPKVRATKIGVSGKWTAAGVMIHKIDSFLYTRRTQP
mgnify:FL=1